MYKINGKEVKTNGYFASYANKNYIIEDDEDMEFIKSAGHFNIFPISELLDVFEDDSNYNFINNTKLDITYVSQRAMTNRQTSKFEGWN